LTWTMPRYMSSIQSSATRHQLPDPVPRGAEKTTRGAVKSDGMSSSLLLLMMAAVTSEQDAADERDNVATPQRKTRSTTNNKRTRTGCLNCRRKRRKCQYILFTTGWVGRADSSAGDESKPTCEGCQSRSERCEWGVKVSFRPGMNVYDYSLLLLIEKSYGSTRNTPRLLN
jgi:hypothetical protein